MTGAYGSLDLHVHTHRSYGVSAAMTPAAIADRAAAVGTLTVGLADHLWLDAARGCRPAVDHLRQREAELSGLRGPVRFLLGAEADCAPGRGAAGGAELSRLGFVICSYHFADVRLGDEAPPATAEGLARLLLGGFRSAVESGVATAAGHPFHVPRRVLAGLPDAVRGALDRVHEIISAEAPPLLAKAARRGVALELNAPALTPRVRPLLLPVFRAARERGCRFILSSDAHQPSELGYRASLFSYARELGLGAADLLPVPGS